MGEKDGWVCGEKLRIRWGIGRKKLRNFVNDYGLPLYFEIQEKIRKIGSFLDPEKKHNFNVDIYWFKMVDVERFESNYEHLIKKDKNIGNTIIETQSNNEDEPGRRLTAKEVAEKIGVDVKTVRANYLELGGMRLGRQYVFFERRLNNAIQERTEMDCPGAERGAQKGEGFSEERGSVDLGSQNEAKTRQRVEREDRHNLFG